MGGLTALVWLPDDVITHETLATTLGLRRFQPPTAGATARWMGTGPVADNGDEPTTAAPAVLDTDTPRRGPTWHETGNGAGKAGDRPDGSEVPAAPPADMAAAPPAAWGSGQKLDPGIGLPSGMEAAASAQGAIVPPPVSTGEENRLPIFESVESDWFRRGRHGADRPARGPGSDSAGWSSPADEGWRAAEVAQAPVSSGVTGAGLPRRVPRANLVPGGVGTVAEPAPAVSPGPPRSASETRDRLAGFQRGIREARAASEDEGTAAGEEDV